MNKKLSEIKAINPREVWKREPDFTEWLAKQPNLDILAKEIGIEMRPIRTSAPAGKFSLDILAEEIGDSDKRIAIENMFNISDHDHLGKLITYGSAFDAKVLILIVTDTHPEHEQAFEWLNEITRPKYSFFVVKFELIQIDNSNPAPHFEIIVQPNEWKRTIKSDPQNKETTEYQLQQLAFWTAFKKYLDENNLYLRIQRPNALPYRDIHIGTPEAHILLRISISENQLSCSLYVRKDKNLVEYLKRHQENIEKAIGQTLTWIDRDVHSHAEILKQNDGNFNPIDIANFQWFYEKSSLFEKVFIKYINDYKKTAGTD